MSGQDSTPPSEQPTPILSAPPGPSPQELQLLQYPEDIRTLWSWKEIIIFVLASVGFYLGVALVVAIVFIATGQSMDALQNSPRVKALFAVIATLVVSIAQIGFLYLYTDRAPGQSFWQAIGWLDISSGGATPPVWSS